MVSNGEWERKAHHERNQKTHLHSNLNIYEWYALEEYKHI
jgi:hypothetical protein